MRYVVAAACCFALGLPPVTSPESEAHMQRPTFRGGVDLVTIDVTVVSKDGRPVEGLAPSDFSIKLSGHQCPVRVLEYLPFVFGKPLPGDGPGGEGGAHVSSPQAVPSVRRERMLVLLLDDVAARSAELQGLAAAAERMLPALDPGDLVGLATTSGLAEPVNPTTDRTVLVRALRRAAMTGRDDESTPGLFIGANEAIDIDYGSPRETLGKVLQRECRVDDTGQRQAGRGISGAIDDECGRRVQAMSRMLANRTRRITEMQISAFKQTIEALRTAPAPRVLILLSSGVALHQQQDLRRYVDVITRSAAEAEVQFYAVTEVNDGFDMSDALPGRATARQEENKFLTAGVQTIATAAGGEAFRVIGQADRFFERVLTETSGLYRVGVEAPTSIGQEPRLRVEVSVNRRGVRVLTRRQVVRP